jgi:transaldolase
MQTDPRLYPDSKAILEEAVEFCQLPPNVIVKTPVTRAGLPDIEEATCRDLNINATVTFTLPQATAAVRPRLFR